MDLISILIVAAICVGIGFFLATLLNNLNEPEAQISPEALTEVEDRVPVLQIWRHAETGAFLPEVNGEVLETAKGLSPEQHAVLSITLVDLYSWMEASDQAMPKLLVETEPEIPPRRKSAAAGAGQTDEAGGSAPAEVKPPSLNIFKSLVRTAKKEATQKIKVETVSISAQVDEILQEKLEASALAGQGIRLMDLPNQGMVIMIGLEKYQDIDSVPDEDIRTLLREAAAEWEARVAREKKEE